MKNFNKGSVAQKILLIVGLIVVIGGVYLYTHNKGFSLNTNLTTFSHSTGAYSLQYPKDWSVESQPLATQFKIKTSNAEVSNLFAVTFDVNGVLNDALQKKSTFTNSSFNLKDGTVVSEYKSTTPGLKFVYYLIPYGSAANHIYLLAYGLTYNASDDLDVLYTPTIMTLVVNQTKTSAVLQAVQDSEVNAREMATEAQFKANLAAIRVYAELYHNDTESFANVCSPVGTAATATQLKTAIKKVIDTAGAPNFKCAAKKDAYAMSIVLPKNKGILCVDTNSMEIISSPMKDFACK